MGHLLTHPFTLLLVQTVAIITTSRLLGLVTRRLGQPMVVAEIVAGVLLGPSLLGWLAPGAAATLFPTGSLELLGTLSQIGLVLFMFLVGLEFDVTLLRGRGRASVTISHTSIAVPFGLGALLAIYLEPRVGLAGVSFTSFALFLGVAMSITAFPVLARILTERRLLRSQVGALTIACAAVNDATAWCLLAFVVSLVRATGISTALVTTGLAIAYVLFMLFALRPFLSRLAQRARFSGGVSQNIVAAAFVLLLVSSTATDLIGLHPLFGGFLLGAVMPRSEGFARMLAEKLEDLVVVFMLPLFFAVSGLHTEIGLLADANAWGLFALVLLVACLGKFGGSFLAARLTGLRTNEAAAVGLLLNTRGLMSLVALNVGLELGIISPTLFTMLVLMALATTMFTSPLLGKLLPSGALEREALERPGPTPVRETAPGGALVYLPRFGASQALRTLTRALARGAAGSTWLLRLTPPPERVSNRLPSPEPTPHTIPLVAEARGEGLDVHGVSFVSADAGNDVCQLADVKGVGLLVLGSHVPLVGDEILGGEVGEVLDGAQTDVGVFVDRGLTQLGRVLVPWRGSPHDAAALRVARRIAQGSGAILTALLVHTPQDPQPVGLPVLDDVALLRVQADDTAAAVAAEARTGVDLVVVGIGRNWGVEHRRFGLFSQRLVDETDTSLLVVRAAPESSEAASEQTPPLPAALARRPVA